MSESNGNGELDIRNIRAAALKYNTNQDQAPVVVAAGSGYIANRIIEIADECGVTVYHDDSAATLLSKLNLGREIPPELYQMVVDIYVSVMSASDSLKETL
ncbi:EscU/YscU/HrcU family type III secretion system export apparatus switch protein [Ruminococcaceae bacterium OttesenSCG-928-L11]|nr:EscU/YscU/HrcU family type III secretion system export apparatus switch protein [Ruminococcaceae bacterium OttesenSCG-928-L11]